MKTSLLFRCGILTLALIVLTGSAAFQPVNAAPAGTLIHGDIAGDVTWTEAGSPYLIDVYANVTQGSKLTLEPGVVIQTAAISWINYNFDVQGTLIARGTAEKPIRFLDTPDGWSGVNIVGTVEHFNTGSVLEYVILDGGGFGNSGSGANLRLADSEVIVRHCEFRNSPGDGILGDNGSSRAVAHVSDSTFINNDGYAINFEDGNVNPVLSNLTASGNGSGVTYGGNFVAITGHGTLNGTHVWENMDLPYLLYNQIVVEPTATLIIEPGTQIFAAPGNDTLDVYGRLLVNGTAQQEVRLDPVDPPNGWSGLQIIGTDAEHPSTGSALDHVVLTGGGYGNSCNLYLEYSDAVVANSRFSASEDSGVCLDSQSWLTMSNTLLTDNAAYAMEAYDPDAHFTLSGLTATGNTSDTIGVWGGGLYGFHSWPNAGINTYDIRGDLVIAAEAGLNLEPGLKLRIEYGRNIGVNGALTATGTAAAPITFTGEISAAGHWAGIAFHGTPTQPARGTFRYATLEHGGYGGGGLVEVDNARVTFDYCTLRHCQSDAVRVFSDPQRAGAPAAGPALANTVDIHWSQLYAINAEAVNNDAANIVQATYNWWGSPSGPQAEDNPNGTGSAVSVRVNYRPYLPTPNALFLYIPLTLKP